MVGMAGTIHCRTSVRTALDILDGVHNAIIENYAELRQALISRGHEFTSETDTEVLAHLIEDAIETARQEGKSGEERIATAIRSALQCVTGAYAIAVLSQEAPQ